MQPGKSDRGRGRPKAFDIDDALDQAIQVFWARGYEHTSLEDLLAAMKLSKSSFYQSFGSKRALYVDAIERYVEKAADPEAPRLPAGLPAIEQFFTSMIDGMTGRGSRHGCFIGLVSMEMGNRDDAVARLAAAGLQMIEERFLACILAAEEASEIPKHDNPHQLARALTSTFYGIQVMGRAHLAREVLEDAVDGALTQLHSPDLNRAELGDS